MLAVNFLNNITVKNSNPNITKPNLTKTISFKGVLDKSNDPTNNNKESSNSSILSKLFSGGKVEIPAEEAAFLKSYEEKEKSIKDKYEQQIMSIKDGRWEKYSNKSENKRNELRQERDKELAVARIFQDTFEQREKELIEIKKQFLDLAEHLNYSREVIIALEREQALSQKRQEINKRRENLLGQSGFSKLAGYVDEKQALKISFIDKVDDEKAGKVLDYPIPNAILLYGPTGCGKTTFAKALAEETDCNYEILSCRGSQKEKEEDFIKKIKGETKYDQMGNKIEIPGLLDKAQNNFLKTNKRTIILVDEFDRFFNKDTSTRFINGMKGILNSCSENNHVTFFLTTNNPQKIPYELLNSHRTGLIVNLDPPDEKNSAAVVDHYLQDCPKDELDYETITKELFKYAPDERYSNMHLQTICDSAINDFKPEGKNLNTDMIINAITKYNESSDNPELLRITKPYLDQYKDDKDKIGE